MDAHTNIPKPPAVEISAFRDRATQLEKQIEALSRTRADSEERVKLLQNVLDALPAAIFCKDRQSRFIGCNKAFAGSVGITTTAELIGKTDNDFPWRDRAAEYQADDRAVFASEEAKLGILEPLRREDGTQIWLETNKVPLRNDNGSVIGLVGTFEDVTARVHAEEGRRREKDRIIEEQEELLALLSTPLLPILDGVLLMPIIGRVETARARVLLERLLEGIAVQHAVTVIVDLTGVPVVDDLVASTVLDLARAAKLLGAQVILTGIGPSLARTIVASGLDFEGISIRGTLRDGVLEVTRARARARPSG